MVENSPSTPLCRSANMRTTWAAARSGLNRGSSSRWTRCCGPSAFRRRTTRRWPWPNWWAAANRSSATLSCYILNTCPELLHYTGIWTDSLRNGQTQLVNTNKLLKRYSGITGLKTGTTSGAGVCISASATRDGLTLIAVILGSPSSADRFNAATTLLDYGFAHYAAVPVPQLPDRPLELAVKGSAEQTVPLDYSALPSSVLLEKGAGAGLRAELTLPEALEAPVQRGQSVGKVEIYAGDTLLSEAEVTAAADAPVLTFGDALELLWQSLLGA